MLRRAFVKTLSVAALAPLLLPARVLGRDPSLPAPSKLLQVGFIGLGGQGRGLLGGFLDETRVRVTALCDVDRRHLRRSAERVDQHYATQPQLPAGPCFQTQDFRALLARDLDAVVIATPDHWHAIPVLAAARRGLHIYLEKPFALTIPEGRAMVAAIEQAGVICQVGSQQRSGSEFQRMVELARNGFFGRINRVEVGLPGGPKPIDRPSIAPGSPPAPIPPELDYQLWLGPAPDAPYYEQRCHFHFRWISDYSGGQLTDWIGHHFDIASWALDVDHTGPVAIRDATATFIADPLFDTADTYAFTAHYAGGPAIHVSSAFRGGLRIEGDQGWAHVDRGRTEFSDARLRRAPIPSQGFNIDRRSWHTGNFVDAILEGSPLICPPETSHRAASVAHLANIAFRTGRSSLQWDPVAERILDAPDAAARLARPYRGPWTLV